MSSALENEFAQQLANAGLPVPEREYAFIPPRKFRFDFCWPDHGKVAVELDGGTWSNGRHARGAGIERDLEKLNLGALAGWRIFRFSTSMVRAGSALRFMSVVLTHKAAA